MSIEAKDVTCKRKNWSTIITISLLISWNGGGFETYSNLIDNPITILYFFNMCMHIWQVRWENIRSWIYWNISRSKFRTTMPAPVPWRPPVYCRQHPADQRPRLHLWAGPRESHQPLEDPAQRFCHGLCQERYLLLIKQITNDEKEKTLIKVEC